MSDTTFESRATVLESFREYERGVRIHNYSVACILALVFMPLGGVLDVFVIQHKQVVWHFLQLRLLSSALLLALWWLVRTPFGLKNLWILGQIVAALPSFFISLMIFETDGARSPYYAGLNLVLLGAGLVLRWTLLDSICVVTTALAMYLLAIVLCPNVSVRQAWASGACFNNLYFLLVTGVFVIIGNYHYNRIRFREFQLRWELDRNRAKLEENNQKLKELDQIKSRFFANISHELRTPLTLLLAPLESLLHRQENLGEEVRTTLATMQSNAMRLLKLINDLLDLVRLESGRMELKLQQVCIPALLRGLSSAISQVAHEKHITVDTRIDPSLSGALVDPDKLEKALLNLLFNALKFTPAGGQITLQADHAGDNLRIVVADTGMGISQKDLPHVFDRFWQADSSSNRKYQGVGIGLALVKELMEIQGGTVAVQSRENKGTTFEILLPYKETALPQNGKPEFEGSGSLTKPKVASEEWLANLYRRAELFPSLNGIQHSLRRVEAIKPGKLPVLLIADDEPDMLSFLKGELSRAYQVLQAVDGNQAIEKACHFVPDLIVLDMMMPEKDGLQVCRELRERPLTQSIPILLLTAKADEQTKLDALSAGANDFLAKPFSTTELNVRINNLVESYAYQRRLAKQNVVLESTIEQLKDTETQLVQTEKMASLGRMSAGIIHEINNPLNFAATGLFTLRKKSAHLNAADRQEYNEVINDVEEGLNRVKNIVLDLRTFTRPDNETTEQVDLVLVVASALRFLSAEWKNTVRIEQRMPEHVYVAGNRNKLIQVMLNLLQNSLDALKSKNFTDEKPTIWVEGEVENDRSILTVRDNGQGIKPEHQDKIFDPFFTTKDVGKGMGLGLSICYRLLEQVNARISVRSEHEKFCEFRLEFPRKIPA